MRYPSIRVGDIDVRYELVDYTAPWRKTRPETVLLHHGYARNMLFWQELVPLLATHYRVLRFDARGCGETTKTPPGKAYVLDRFVKDAIGLVDALAIDRVHWVGESSGGIIGMVAALNQPRRLSTLTLCDTPFKRSDEIASTYTVGESDRAAAFDKYGVGGWCRKTL
jgi:3-oxoadipate enol-lactonase